MKRIQLIQKLGEMVECLKEHKFYIQNENLILETRYIKKAAPPDFAETVEALKILANQLEYLNSLDLPHGDILSRNVIWDGFRFILIDWEPLLEYVHAPNIFFKASMPYISQLDRKNLKITANTDKIAFHYFCRKQLFGWFATDKKEVKKNESELIRMRFYELVDLAISSHLNPL